MTELNYRMTSTGPIEPGVYEVKIVRDFRDREKQGTGDHLQMTLEIVAGKHAGRKIFDWLELWSSHDQKRDRAIAKLETILEAIGIREVADSRQLHNIVIGARVIWLDKFRAGRDPFFFVEQYCSRDQV
jgi:hypothetical protein